MICELHQITQEMVTSMNIALSYYGYRWEVVRKALEYKYKVKLENSLLLERKFYNLPQLMILKFKTLLGDEKQYLIRLAHKHLNNPTKLWFAFNSIFVRRMDAQHVQQWALKIYSHAITSIRVQQTKSYSKTITIIYEMTIRFLVHLMNDIPCNNEFFLRIRNELIDFQEYCNFDTKWKNSKNRTKIISSASTQEKLESLCTTILMINQMNIDLNPHLVQKTGKQVISTMENQTKIQKSEFYVNMQPLFVNFCKQYEKRYEFKHQQDSVKLYLYYLFKPNQKPIFIDESLNKKKSDDLFDMFVNFFIQSLKEVCEKYKLFSKSRFYERLYPSVIQNLLNDLRLNTSFIKLHTLLIGSQLHSLGQSQSKFMTGTQIKTLLQGLLDDVQAIRELDY